MRGNPVAANVEAGLKAYHAGAHDGVVAFGGGSGLDAGKVIAFMSGQTRPLWDFEDVGDWWTRADPKGIAPVVAVPTTAGTGSEVGRAGVILNEETHQKKIIFHPKMMPGIVIADPELTVGLPPKITAATGFDALVHCFEAFCAPGFHPLADGVALEGMRLIKTYLPRACKNGGDMEARSRMLAAASMGATAFQKGLGAVHAIAHPVGSFFDTHHGLTNAVITPYVIVHNRDAIAERMKVVARVLDLPKPGVDGVLDWVLEFRKELGIPHSLAEIGVTLRNPEEIGREAAIDPSAGGNPDSGRRGHARAHFPLGGEGRPVAQELDADDAHPGHRRQRGGDARKARVGRRHVIRARLRRDAAAPASAGIEMRHRAARRRGAQTTRRRRARRLSRRRHHRFRAERLFARSRRGTADRAGESRVRRRRAVFRQLLGTAGGRHRRRRQRGAQSARPRVRLRRGASRSRARAGITPCSRASPKCSKPATVHVDTVESLARRRHAARAQRHGPAGRGDPPARRRTFWGVQYHPEYSCAEIAAMARRYRDVLIRDGLVKDRAELDALAADLVALHEHPDDARLAWRFGVGSFDHRSGHQARRTPQLARTGRC